MGADWVLSLDADERIDEGDAAALRRLVDGEGDPSCGYMVEVHRMIGDEHHYDKSSLWVGRLFAFRPGQRFGGTRLHMVPLPTAIPPERWRRTTLRTQHLGDLDDDRRRARFAKYQQADPGHRSQTDYSNLLVPPTHVRPWRPRPPALPLLFNERGTPDPSATAAAPADDVLTLLPGALARRRRPPGGLGPGERTGAQRHADARRVGRLLPRARPCPPRAPGRPAAPAADVVHVPDRRP